MKPWKILVLVGAGALVAADLYGVLLIRRGLTTADQPSHLERIVARTTRKWAIPQKARLGSEAEDGTSTINSIGLNYKKKC